jgi:hypothetical protein
MAFTRTSCRHWRVARPGVAVARLPGQKDRIAPGCFDPVTGRHRFDQRSLTTAAVIPTTTRPSLRAGRFTQLRPGVAGQLDMAFQTERAPFCGTLF